MTTAVRDQPKPAADARAEWMSVASARRQLGVGQQSIDRLIRESVLTVRRIPGCRPQILRRDVEELERQSIHVGRGFSTFAPTGD